MALATDSEESGANLEHLHFENLFKNYFHEELLETIGLRIFLNALFPLEF